MGLQSFTRVIEGLRQVILIYMNVRDKEDAHKSP